MTKGRSEGWFRHETQAGEALSSALWNDPAGSPRDTFLTSSVITTRRLHHGPGKLVTEGAVLLMHSENNSL